MSLVPPTEVPPGRRLLTTAGESGIIDNNKKQMNMSRLSVKIMALPLAAVCLALPFAALADYTTSDVISLNISNDDNYMMVGDGETETLAGLLPDNAWKNTKQSDRTGVWHSGDARNGYSNGVTAWDGTKQEAITLSDVVFSWAVEGDATANFGSQNMTPAFRGAWLARASGANDDAAIEVQNIPYERYDVIIYLSGKASNGATSVYRAVCVNGIPYVGDTSAEGGTVMADSMSVTWGTQQNDYELGKNALKLTGLTSDTLFLFMRNSGNIESANQGIAAVQIVRDMSAIGVATRPVSTANVISVNLQSARNGTGEKPDYFGLERVPANAWTDDGFSAASSGGANVTAAIKEWNGATGLTTTLAGLTINEKAANAWNWAGTGYVPILNLINAYLDDGGDRAQVTVEGVPYKKYDVIVYCATDTSDRQFGPVTVNGKFYRWNASTGATEESGSADSTAATRWGFSRGRIAAYGANALRITDQTSSTLTIKGGNNAYSARGGIAGFQIVDTAEADETPVEAGGTYVVNAHITETVRLVCPGSFTITGTGSYTATETDIAKLDLTGVTGTATLGANTLYALDSSRALPGGKIAFGEGSSVAITETAEEFAKDVFRITGLTGVSSVKLTRYDGTEETLTVKSGTATRGNGKDIKVTGVAALYDFTFTNTLATATGSRITATMGQDATPVYETGDDVTGVGVTAYPYITLSSYLPEWSEFSVAVVGRLTNDTNKAFISFGNGHTSMLFLSAGSKENEVAVCYGNSSSVEVLTTMTVPNAATARHLYAFIVSENRTRLTIYLDGVKWRSVEKADGFALGSTSQSGIQIGKGFAANPAGYGSATGGVFYSLLIYDYMLSESQMAELKRLYPYVSSSSLFTREVSGNVKFNTAKEPNMGWRNETEGSAGNQPDDNSEAVMTATGDAVVTVNLGGELSLASLTLNGPGSISFKKGGETLSCAGRATIATDVTIELGSVDISGAPVDVAAGGSLRFDCSGYPLDGQTASEVIPLTGTMEEQSEGVVTFVLPEQSAVGNQAELVYKDGCYNLVVTLDHSPTNVWLKEGTTELSDSTRGWRYVGEDRVDSSVATGDTVCFEAQDEITVSRTYPVVGYDFGEVEASVVLDVEGGNVVTNKQTFSGPAGSVAKTGDGTLVLTRGNSASLDVRGGTLKLSHASDYSFWNEANITNLPSVTVAGGATFDLNGSPGYKAAVTLAKGAVWANTGINLNSDTAQAYALSLTGDATVRAPYEFGLLANGWGPTTLDMGGSTLTKSGSAIFWLYNTTVTGGGKIKIADGTVYAYGTVDAADTAFDIAERATLKVVAGGTGDFSAGEIGGYGTVDLGTSRPKALAFTGDNILKMKIKLASTTEKEIRIKYTGKVPTVRVINAGNDDDSEDASCTTAGGEIRITVNVADVTRENPARPGETQGFTYVFTGEKNDKWEAVENWLTSASNRWRDYDGEAAPGVTNNYDTILIDGNLMTKVTKGKDGYKRVTAESLDGWNLRIGAFNGAYLTINLLGKLQSDAQCWLMVDDSSKIVVKNRGSGNNSNPVNMYVAAADGVVFETDFDFSKHSANTVNYYLSGEGSVKYAAGVTTGTHAIKGVVLAKGLPKSNIKRLITRRLVSFASGASNVNFALDEVAVTSLDSTLVMTEYDDGGDITTEADFGAYQLKQKSDGIYITYVGYASPFLLFIR